MTESPAGAGSARWSAELPVAFSDPVYVAAVVDLLGAIAYGEISAFERLSRGRQDGPDPGGQGRAGADGVHRVRPLRGAAGPARRARRRPVRRDGRLRRAVRGVPPAHGAGRLARGPGQGVRRGRAGRRLLPRDRGVPRLGHPRDHPREPAGRRPVGVRRRPGPGRHRGGPPGRRPARAVGSPADGGGAVPGAAGRRRARRPGALLSGGVDRPALDLAAIGRLFTRLTENHTARMEKLGLSA